MDIIYLGISGVLHASKSTYEMVVGRTWSDTHHEYEAVPVLERLLEPWPAARIVLTSTQPWAHGLPAVLAKLGPTLAARVVSFTFEDLTKRAIRELPTRSGAIRRLTRSAEDYWRMNKSDIVLAHVEWLKPARWIAVDDDDILWPATARRDHLVDVDGCKGLLDPVAQDRLLTVLHGNFGPGFQH